MAVQTNYVISSPHVIVDNDGHIGVHLGDDTHNGPVEQVCTLSHKAAIDLALALVQSVTLSIDRNQKDVPSYYDSASIIARMESPRGRAISALKAINGA